MTAGGRGDWNLRTLRSRDGGGLVLAFDLSQLVVQVRCFHAGVFSFGSVLDGGNASHCVEDFGHGVAFAMADVFQLVGEPVLIQGDGLGVVNATLKISDFRPALRLRNGGIADRYGRVLPFPAVILQIVGETLEVIFALDVSPVGRKTVPGQCPGIVGLNALPELIHPA